jgi:MFS family permease
MMFQKKFIPKFLHALALIFIQQFSGLNGLLTNLSQIFEAANSSLKPTIASLIAMLASIPSCFLCSWLVERIGRRPTFMLALAGGTLAHLLSWAQDVFNLSTIIPVIALFIYMFAFGMGIGPVVWIVIPELFEDSVRSVFMSLIVMLNWGFAGAVAFLWPTIESGIGLGWGFFIFACVCAMAIIYAWRLMPETRADVIAGGAAADEDKDEGQVPEPDEENKGNASAPEQLPEGADV